MRIGVDLDDVLVRMNEALMRFHNTMYGTRYALEEVKSFDLDTVWNCSHHEMIERINQFYQAHDPHDISPIEGARENLNLLKNENELFIITGRPHTLEEKTRKTMARHYPGIFNDVHFTNYFNERSAAKTKAQFCTQLGIELFIEDNHEWAHQVANAGINTLLFDAPWNREPVAHEKVKRISHWNEVQAFVPHNGKTKNGNEN